MRRQGDAGPRKEASKPATTGRPSLPTDEIKPAPLSPFTPPLPQIQITSPTVKEIIMRYNKKFHPTVHAKLVAAATSSSAASSPAASSSTALSTALVPAQQ